MDLIGFYSIIRVRDQSRGEKLNIGIVAFWRWAWVVKTDDAAISRAVTAFPQVDEYELRQFLNEMPWQLGFRAPGEFDPNFAYVTIHQFRQQNWNIGAVEFSTLRQVRVGYDGQYGYEGGVEEAAEDLFNKLVAIPEDALYAA